MLIAAQPAPPPDRLSPNVERLAAAAAAAAAAAEEAAAVSSSAEAAYEAAAAANRAAQAAATAAASEVAAGPLLPATEPVLCIADHGRRPLLFLSAADLAVFKEHIHEFKQLLDEFRQHATVRTRV